MEKPAPAKDQRWSYAGRKWTLTVPAFGGWDAIDDDGVGGNFSLSMFASQHAEYLGPPSTPVEGGRPVMEVNECGEPVRCLSCGGDKRALPYHCKPCWGDSRSSHESQDALTEAWLAGARDFPRPTLTPAPTVAPACERCADPNATYIEGRTLCKQCYLYVKAGGQTVAVPGPTSKPLYGRMVGEMRGPDGTPLTALGAIQARKPEPYVCPVDDWDLLPDAGTSYRSGR